MTKFINLTPHAIVVEGADGIRTTYPASGQVARVAVTREVLNSWAGHRIVRQKFGQVENLPSADFDPDACYIVSALVLSALGENCFGCVAPDTGPDAIRENGQIVAVRGFVTGG